MGCSLIRRLKASLRAGAFFFRIIGRTDYVGRVGIGHAIHCSGVIFDLWMGRFDR